jgi:hypothetical protein
MERARSGAAAALTLVWLLAWAGAGFAAEKASPPPFDPVLPGATEAELRERFGSALRPVAVTPVRSAYEQVLEAPKPPGPESAAPEPFAGQSRLVRMASESGGAVRAVEYDLLRGVVYRSRWQLAERFERPLMEPLVVHLTGTLGQPAYDQTVEAKLGSGRSELRRAGWQRGDRWLEVRQLHPLSGGPLFVTLSDRAMMQSIVDAEGVVMPQPETSGDWWRKPQKPPRLLGAAERDRLLAEFDALLAPIEF